LSTLFSLCIYF